MVRGQFVYVACRVKQLRIRSGTFSFIATEGRVYGIDVRLVLIHSYLTFYWILVRNYIYIYKFEFETSFSLVVISILEPESVLILYCYRDPYSYF